MTEVLDGERGDGGCALVHVDLPRQSQRRLRCLRDDWLHRRSGERQRLRSSLEDDGRIVG